MCIGRCYLQIAQCKRHLFLPPISPESYNVSKLCRMDTLLQNCNILRLTGKNIQVACYSECPYACQDHIYNTHVAYKERASTEILEFIIRSSEDLNLAVKESFSYDFLSLVVSLASLQAVFYGFSFISAVNWFLKIGMKIEMMTE